MGPLDWTLIILFLMSFATIVIYNALRRYGRIGMPLSGQRGRVLIVIAHPDDECMFFAPTVLALTRSGQHDVFLLCVSSGNFYNQGKIRQQELMNSCCTLGIRQSNVFVLDHRDLQDTPNVDWSEQLIAQLISDYIKSYYIDLIFTFDHYGVSGHPNHKSLFHGVRYFLSSADCPAGVRGYQLVSISIIRKYLSFVELAVSYFSSKIIFIATWKDLVKAQVAMYCHKSQLKWFRILYVVFSRYMVVNTYLPIAVETASVSNNVKSD